MSSRAGLWLRRVLLIGCAAYLIWDLYRINDGGTRTLRLFRRQPRLLVYPFFVLLSGMAMVPIIVLLGRHWCRAAWLAYLALGVLLLGFLVFGPHILPDYGFVLPGGLLSVWIAGSVYLRTR